MKNQRVLKKCMNLSFEEKYHFTHIFGEILTLNTHRDTYQKTILCILDKGKDYRYGIRLVGKELCKKGYQVYCFEFDETESEISFEKKVKYIIEIVSCFKKSKDTEEVYLLGIGKGAAYAEATACKIPDRIRAMLFFCPEFVDELFNDEYQEECYQEDKEDYSSKFKGPVFIIHGEKDKIITVKNSEKLLDCYNTAELSVLSGQSHEFSYFGKKKAVDLCSEFIEKIEHKQFLGEN